MKNIITYITESSNKDSMFFGKLSRRLSDDFNFNAGEKVILIKYDTDGYIAQLRSVYNIKKVNKNRVIISHDDPDYQDTIDVLGLKFDKKGIMIKKNKNKYRGNSTTYWVLYNKELIDDGKQNDIKELLDKGRVEWGFHFRNKEEDIEELKKYVKEIK